MHPQIKQIFTGIIKREGGFKSFTNITDDRGGATRAGLTHTIVRNYYGLGNIPAIKLEAIMQAMTNEEILDVYEALFWIEPHFDQLFRNYTLHKEATIVADTAVNHGAGRAVIILQKTVNDILATYNNRGVNSPKDMLATDGIIGPQTIRAARPIMKYGKFSKLFLRSRLQFYHSIVIEDPTQLKFLNGWANRIFLLQDLVSA